jgi:hypothetical protein
MSRERRLLALSCPFVRKHQRDSHWTDFREVWYRVLLKTIDREVASSAKVGQKHRAF